MIISIARESASIGAAGFSLVEVLVAAAIVSIVSLAMATIIADSNKQIAFMNVRLEANSLNREIETALRDTTGCARNMQNNGIRFPTAQLALNGLSTYDSNGNALSVVLPPPPGNVQLNSLTVINVQTIQALAASGGQFIADLNVNLQPTNGSLIALAPHVVKGIKFVTDSAGNVTSCGYQVSNCVMAMVGPHDTGGGYNGKIVSNPGSVTVSLSEAFNVYKPSGSSLVGLQCNSPKWVLSTCTGQGLYNGPGGVLGTIVTIDDSMLPNGCFIAYSQVPPASAQSQQTGLYATCCTAY